MSANYDEDVATSIAVIGVVDIVGMSASVESCREPHVAPSSPIATSLAEVVGDDQDLCKVYIVGSAYSFIIDPHVQDLYQV